MGSVTMRNPLLLALLLLVGLASCSGASALEDCEDPSPLRMFLCLGNSPNKSGPSYYPLPQKRNSGLFHLLQVRKKDEEKESSLSPSFFRLQKKKMLSPVYLRLQ